MSDYDDIAHGSELPGPDGPPPDAEGLDRPDENEDALDDTAPEFDDAQDDAAEAEDKLSDSDNESLLSDVDEAVIDEFDENKLEIAPDFETLRNTKIRKRKRDENDDGRPKKKERTRERALRRRGEDAVDAADIEAGGTRSRKTAGGERKSRAQVEIDEETLPPEERRKRALDRAMDAAVKRTHGGVRRRKGEIVCLTFFIIALVLTKPRTSNKWQTKN